MHGKKLLFLSMVMAVSCAIGFASVLCHLSNPPAEDEHKMACSLIEQGLRNALIDHNMCHTNPVISMPTQSHSICITCLAQQTFMILTYTPKMTSVPLVLLMAGTRDINGVDHVLPLVQMSSDSRVYTIPGVIRDHVGAGCPEISNELSDILETWDALTPDVSPDDINNALATAH